MENSKQENSTVEISIVGIFWHTIVKTTKKSKNIDKEDGADEIIHMKTNAFEARSTLVFTRGPDKRKYGELIHDISIRYAIKNNQYPKTPQEEVDLTRREKFKPEKNNDKSNTQKQIKIEVMSKINEMKRVLHKHRNMEKVLFLWFRNTYVK